MIVKQNMVQKETYPKKVLTSIDTFANLVIRDLRFE
jgi:hypothetical protein